MNELQRYTQDLKSKDMKVLLFWRDLLEDTEKVYRSQARRMKEEGNSEASLYWIRADAAILKIKAIDDEIESRT